MPSQGAASRRFLPHPEGAELKHPARCAGQPRLTGPSGAPTAQGRASPSRPAPAAPAEARAATGRAPRCRQTPEAPRLATDVSQRSVSRRDSPAPPRGKELQRTRRDSNVAPAARQHRSPPQEDRTGPGQASPCWGFRRNERHPPGPSPTGGGKVMGSARHGTERRSAHHCPSARRSLTGSRLSHDPLQLHRAEAAPTPPPTPR